MDKAEREKLETQIEEASKIKWSIWEHFSYHFGRGTILGVYAVCQKVTVMCFKKLADIGCKVLCHSLFPIE
jgi:hypothetical protein